MTHDASPSPLVSSPETPRPEAAPAQGVWQRFLHCPNLSIPAGVAIVNLALTLFTVFATLQDFPPSADEYAYLISAEIFARGRTSVPSPALPRFFDVTHVVNNGRFYGKYPPGWPAILAVGVLAGVPWLVNPLLGAATVLTVYALARRHFAVPAANTAALSLLACPYLVFHSASYFSHSAGLLAVVLFLKFVFDVVDRPAGAWPYVAIGACAGVAFLIRPFTAVTLLAVPTVYLLLPLRRAEGRRARLLGLTVAAVPFLICLGLFFEYNRIQTGNPFLQPFVMYAPWDVPTLPNDAEEWGARLVAHVLLRTWELSRWLPLSPLFLVLACSIRATRREPRIRVLILSFAALFIAYFFYYGAGGFRYGPRYLYEAMGGLAILTGVVIVALGRRGSLMLASVLLASAGVFVLATEQVSALIVQKKDVYLRVQERRLANSVVFMRTDSGPAPLGDCLRNGIDFKPPVLFVRDLGPTNLLLLQKYPGRDAYYYEFDASVGKGRLTPFAPE